MGTCELVNSLVPEELARRLDLWGPFWHKDSPGAWVCGKYLQGWGCKGWFSTEASQMPRSKRVSLESRFMYAWSLGLLEPWGYLGITLGPHRSHLSPVVLPSQPNIWEKKSSECPALPWTSALAHSSTELTLSMLAACA